MSNVKLSNDNYTVDIQLGKKGNTYTAVYTCSARKVLRIFTNSFEFVHSKGMIPQVTALNLLYDQEDFLEFVLDVQ